MKHLFCFTYFFCFVVVVFAQNLQHEIDSLQQELKVAPTDIDKVGILVDLGRLFLEINLNASNDYYTQALGICKKYPDDFKPIEEAFLLDCLGVLERRRSNYEKAFEYYLSALVIKESINDSVTLGRSYHNIAILFNKQKEYDRARHYFLKALPLRKKLRDSVSYAKTLNAYGVTLRSMDKVDSAYYYFEQAEHYFGNHVKLADAHTQLAILAKKRGDYKEAISVYLKSLEIFETHGLNEKLLSTNILIASAYWYNKQPDEALPYLQKAEKLALKSQNTKYLLKIYLNYSRVYKDMGDFQNAYQYAILYKDYSDSTYNSERVRAMTALEMNYDYEKHKLADSLQFMAEKQLLQSKAEGERTQKWLFAVSLILVIMGLYHSLTRHRHKLKEEHLEKEVLNEKLYLLKIQVEQLSNDNQMRVQYKKELLEKIKRLKDQKDRRSIKELQNLTLEIQSQINTENRLDALAESKKSLDPTFEQRLIELHPDLTKSEREICNLIRMNLSMKEIANIRNTSVGAIRTTRYRIRKKMEIAKGKELEMVIQNIA